MSRKYCQCLKRVSSQGTGSQREVRTEPLARGFAELTHDHTVNEYKVPLSLAQRQALVRVQAEGKRALVRAVKDQLNPALDAASLLVMYTLVQSAGAHLFCGQGTSGDEERVPADQRRIPCSVAHHQADP